MLGGVIYPHPEHIGIFCHKKTGGTSSACSCPLSQRLLSLIKILKEWIFIAGAIFGVCDSIWQSSLSAVYGTLFQDKKEAAFSNRNFWRSLGSVIGNVI